LAFGFGFCYSISSSVLRPYIFSSSFLTLLYLISTTSSSCYPRPFFVYISCLANLIPILKCLLSSRLLDCCGLLDKWLHCPEESF
ncbi:hypothetical protein B0H13DRAFT_1982480, partial [Mycena leptocephala]